MQVNKTHIIDQLSPTKQTHSSLTKGDSAEKLLQRYSQVLVENILNGNNIFLDFNNCLDMYCLFLVIICTKSQYSIAHLHRLNDFLSSTLSDQNCTHI